MKFLKPTITKVILSLFIFLVIPWSIFGEGACVLAVGHACPSNVFFVPLILLMIDEETRPVVVDFSSTDVLLAYSIYFGIVYLVISSLEVFARKKFKKHQQ